MLVNILKTFDDASGARRFPGENLDVPREVAAMWIADGYASRDTDGQINPLSGGGAVFTPLTDDYLGIETALSMAWAAGGGIVQLKGVIYNIGDNMIQARPYVELRGTGMGVKMFGDVVDAGTIIRSTSTTKPVIGYNWEDRATPFPTGGEFKASSIRGFSVRHLQVEGGLFGIKLGARYIEGVENAVVENVASVGALDRGFWFENCHVMRGEHLNAFAYRGGGLSIVSSGSNITGGSAYWNHGQIKFEQVTCESEYRLACGVELLCRGANASLNDTHVKGCAVMMKGVLVTETVTVTAGNAQIPVADVSNYRVNNCVMFNSQASTSWGTVTGLRNDDTYFIRSVTPQTPGATTGPGTITISYKRGDTIITPGGTGTVNATLGGRGGVGLFVGYDPIDQGGGSSGGLTACTVTEIDIENTGSVMAVLQNASSTYLQSGFGAWDSTALGGVGYYATFVVRGGGYDNNIRALGACDMLDMEGGSRLAYQGKRPFRLTNGMPSGLVMNITNDPTVGGFATTTNMSMWLEKNTAIHASNDSRAAFPTKLGLFAMQLGNVTNAGIGNDWAQVQVYNTTGAASANLTQGNAGYPGIAYYFYNAGNGTLTLNCQGSMTINAVAGWTSITLAPKSFAVLRFMRTDGSQASTNYWQIESCGQLLVPAITTSKTLTHADVPPAGIPTLDVTTTGLTLTLDGTVGSFDVLIPASGQVTLAVSGSATMNGATASITRTAASNPGGIISVRRSSTTTAYRVSGA